MCDASTARAITIFYILYVHVCTVLKVCDLVLPGDTAAFSYLKAGPFNGVLIPRRWSELPFAYIPACFVPRVARGTFHTAHLEYVPARLSGWICAIRCCVFFSFSFSPIAAYCLCVCFCSRCRMLSRQACSWSGLPPRSRCACYVVFGARVPELQHATVV